MPRPRTRGDHKAAGSVGSQDAVEQAGEGARKDELQILEKGGCQSEEEKNRKDQKLPAEAEPADGRIDKNIAAIAPEGGGGSEAVDKDICSSEQNAGPSDPRARADESSPAPESLDAAAPKVRIAAGGEESAAEASLVIPEPQRNMCKLFVGRIPFYSTESDLRPLFEAYGTVRDVHVITKNSRSKGCAFVTYNSFGEAEACIEALHNQVTLPRGPGPLQISLARGEAERLGVSQADGGEMCKLFFGMLPYSYGEHEIRSLLSPSVVPANCIDMVHILRKNGGSGAPTGCAFVRVKGGNQAALIIERLNTKVQLPGAPNVLNVSYAQSRNFHAPPSQTDSGAAAMTSRKRRRQDPSGQRHLGQPMSQRVRTRNDKGSASGVFKLHVANLSFQACEDDLLRLFGRYGRILDVCILREREGARLSKGAAFVKYGFRDEAEVAISQLNGTTQFGYEKPIRVTFAIERNGSRRPHMDGTTPWSRQTQNLTKNFGPHHYQHQIQNHQMSRQVPSQYQQMPPPQIHSHAVAYPNSLHYPPHYQRHMTYDATATHSNPYDSWGSRPSPAPQQYVGHPLQHNQSLTYMSGAPPPMTRF